MLKLLNCTVYLEFLEPKIFKMGSLSSDSYDNLKAKLENFYLRTVFLMPMLNVPQKVATKVKNGTTLSFLASSSDQKYVVISNKIHPPVKHDAPKHPNKVSSQPSLSVLSWNHNCSICYLL